MVPPAPVAHGSGPLPRAPVHGRTAGSRSPASVSAPPASAHGRAVRDVRRVGGAALPECTGRPGGTPGPAGARGARVVRTADASRVQRLTSTTQGSGPYRVADPVGPPAGSLRTGGPPPGHHPRRGTEKPSPRPSCQCPLGTADRAIPRRCTPPGAATGQCRPHRARSVHGPRTRQSLPAPERQAAAPVPRGSHPAGPLQVPPRASRAGAGSSLSRAGPAGGRGPPPWAGSAERRPRSPPAPRSCRWG